jgi:NitT/TauT family transport system ATP-binding protein
MSELVLRAEHIGKTYHTSQGELVALKDVSFQAAPGEFLAIVGPSGCGKTTLLRILGGLSKPTAGRVYLDGSLLDSPRHEFGFVFQKANLMPWRTVLTNVTLPLELQGWDRHRARARASELLELVGLADFAAAYPRELSGGMEQRVAIARALSSDPAILLLDEPFGALDALSRERMNLELLRIWGAQRKTVIMVTHDVREAVFLSDRVLVLSQRPGQLAATVNNTLPRPRSSALFYSELFNVLAYEVRNAIR